MHKIVVLFLLLLMIAGCNPHRSVPVTPPADAPSVFAGVQADAGSLARGRWWEAFADEELNRLINEALTHNYDLEQAFARMRQSEALLALANGGQLPALSAGGDVKTGHQPGPNGDIDGTSRSLSLAASFEIDLWGRLAARSRGAAADYSASQEEVKALMLGLSARVADGYYLVIEQRAQMQLADHNIEAYTKTVEMVERRYKGGLVPAVDLYQARLNLASSQASRQATASALQQAEHALSVLVGRYPGAEIAGTLATLPAPPEAFPAGLPSELLARRPDLQAAMLRVEASDARLAAAIAERFPSINLLGSYGYSRSTFSVPTLAGEFWNLAGGLTLPLFDGGRRRSEVARQDALLAESLARYRQTVLVAFQEVEDALVRDHNDSLRIASLVEAEAAASSSLRLATARYQSGLNEYLQVLTAQLFQAQVQSNLLAARRQLLADRISLARAIGGDWMQAAIVPFSEIKKESTP